MRGGKIRRKSLRGIAGIVMRGDFLSDWASRRSTNHNSSQKRSKLGTYFSILCKQVRRTNQKILSLCAFFLNGVAFPRFSISANKMYDLKHVHIEYLSNNRLNEWKKVVWSTHAQKQKAHSSNKWTFRGSKMHFPIEFPLLFNTSFPPEFSFHRDKKHKKTRLFPFPSLGK